MKETNTIRTWLLLIVMLLLNVSMAFAQKFTISGYVTEAGSGEPLIGVAVLSRGTTSGTVTSNTGYYSISLDGGSVQLEFSYIGYKTRIETIQLSANHKLNISLEEDADLLQGAVVTSSFNNTGVRGTLMSAVEIPVNQIKAIPAIAGEVDVIKAIQLLPGVQSGTEGTAGIYVRGGGADENLLLMDGVPLYNVNHLFGFFSVFNADALKNVTLYKGSFPARFGGHLSSVIDVRMNDGNENELHGSLSVGLISSKFNLEGPLVKGRTTFNISARRTYLDLLAKPAIALVNRRERQDKYNYDRVGGGYDFYDLNAKITHRLGNGDRISLAIYSGDDKARVTMEEMERSPELGYNYDTGQSYETGNLNHDFFKTKVGWKWGNLVSALRWSHELSPKLYLNTSASYTQYRSLLSLAVDEEDALIVNGHFTDQETESISMKYNSLINDISGNVDLEWHPNVRHDIKFGLSYTDHSFKPGISTFSQKYISSDPDENQKSSLKFGDTPIHSDEAAAYFEDNWTVTPWLKLDLGLRSSLYAVAGKNYVSLEPRISGRALLSDDLSVKASYSEMSQYIHLLCNSNLSLPSDIWVPVTDKIKPMRSSQTAAGVFYQKGGFEYSIEGYYKTMDNVLEYKDGASYMSSASGWEDKVSMGRGWSYGVELLAQKKIGKTTGWIGYTWSKAMRQFDRPGNIINDGNPFPAKYDRRHDLSATVTHTFSKKFDISATFVYSSGNCGTLSFEDYVGVSPDIDNVTKGDKHYSTLPYIPGRNNYRMPAYNRMDIGMNFYKQKKRGTRVWNISVYNVYNRLNPFLVTDDMESEWDPVSQQYKTRVILKKVSIFPIIPSVSYTFKF